MTKRQRRVFALCVSMALLGLLWRPVKAQEIPQVSYPPCPSPAAGTGISAYINCIPNPLWK